MIVRFKEKSLRQIYETSSTKDRKYSKFCRNMRLVDGYRRAVDLMLASDSTKDLSSFSFLHYEKLRHQTMSSIRIGRSSDVERLLFTEDEEGVTVELIEINSTHYGKKR